MYFHSGDVVSDSLILGEIRSLGTQLTQEYKTSTHETKITVFLKESGHGIQYYFANHSTKSICWLNNERPEIMSKVANNRVANTLTQEYWHHMENFPAPKFTNESDLKHIQNVLAGLAVGKCSTQHAVSVAHFYHLI